MKKLISVILVITLIFSLGVPAFASEEKMNYYGQGKVPSVAIFGDGEGIYDENGNAVFVFSQLLSKLTGSEEGNVTDAVFNILTPFLAKGVIKDDWDDYYDALEKEIGDIFEDARFDKNGENPNNTGISKESAAYVESVLNRKYDENSLYYSTHFIFKYDWRKDPLVVADELNDYIQRVKKSTGKDKVALNARCLGSNVATAYLKKYGTKDLTGVGFASSVANGAEIISSPLSGKFRLDGNAISRFITDLNDLGKANIDEFVTKSIDLLENSGLIDGVIGVTKEYLYYKVVEGVTSALALSTFFTWPAYWSCVSNEDYDEALNYVFGKEGSKKRIEYAGLIEKIENYHNTVGVNVDEIMRSAKADGINVCIIAKYGRQLAPICAANDQIADQFVVLNKSSYGATTSDIYHTFSDEYVAQRVSEGKGKYISPDKKVDTSTCLFPEYTWVFKGVSHSDYTEPENLILYTVTSYDRQLTVDDLKVGRFTTFNIDKSRPSNPNSGTHMNYFYTWENMTEENCNNEAWEARESVDKPQTKLARVFSFVITLLRWLVQLYKFGDSKGWFDSTTA